MSWLSEWLKELILIILIATFAELLLPNHSMQRYVKTVVGLFLLTVLLSPVLQLLNHGWNAEKLVGAAFETLESDQSAVAASGQAGKMESLKAILDKSGKLQETNLKQAQQLLETELAGTIKADVERESGQTVHQVEVATQIDSKGTPSIRTVKVVLSHDADAPPTGGTGPPGQVKGIAEIKPVVVNIEPIGPETDSQETKSVPASASEDAKTAERTTAVRKAIEKEWQLRPEQISVTIDQDSKPSITSALRR